MNRLDPLSRAFYCACAAALAGAIATAGVMVAVSSPSFSPDKARAGIEAEHSG